MKSLRHLQFFEKMTRKLRDSFDQINQLCVEELRFLEAEPDHQILPSPELAEEDLLQPQPEAIQVDSPHEEEAPKNAKTKKIKKEGSDKEEQKESEAGKLRKKGKKFTHKPKAPPSSFLLFFKDQQGNISKAYPTYGVTQLTKVAAKLWGEYSAELKAPYIKMCDEQRRIYQERMIKYRVEYPEQIAEKERERQSKRKLKNGTKDKDTPKKEKVSSEAPKIKAEPEVKNPPIEAEPQIIPQESISDSNSAADIDEEDSLGII